MEKITYAVLIVVLIVTYSYYRHIILDATNAVLWMNENVRSRSRLT